MVQRVVTNQRESAYTGKMSPSDRRRVLSRLVDEFERRGWREDGHTALALVSMVANSESEPTAEDVDRAVGRRFQVQTATGPAEIRRALTEALRAEHP
jgi:hypothetical protein